MGYETVLTDARAALWNAIDNFDDLQRTFKAKFKFDSDNTMLREAEPAYSDLPAIGIWPTSVIPKWYVNTMQRWPYTLRMQIWTSGWLLGPAEKVFTQIARAIHRSAPPNTPTVPYTKDVMPLMGPAASFQRTVLNKETNPVRVVLTTIDVVLRCNFQPNT